MKGRAFPIALTVGLLIVVYVISRLIGLQELEVWVKNAGVYGPLILILLTIITGVFAPISGTPVNLAGFILYGPNTVFLFAVSGIISAIINFYIAKRWGRPIVEKFIGKDDIKHIDEFTKEHGIVSLFVMRIFLGSINDFLSYAMGLTAMKFKPYMIASVPGIIVGILIWYIIALNSKTPLAFIVGTLVIGTVFAAVYGLYKVAQKASNNIES